MKKAIWIISGLLTIIVSLVYFYFKGSLQLNSKSDLYAYLSEKNAIILDFKYESDLSEILKDDKNLPSFFYESFVSEIGAFEDIIIKNKELQQAFISKDILVASQKINAKTLGCIYLVSLNNYESDDYSTLFNSDDELVVKAKSRAFDGDLIYNYDRPNLNFYYTYSAPYLLVSKHQSLIEDAIRAKQKGNNLAKYPIFQKWQTEQESSKSIMSVFVNHKCLSDFYSLFFKLPLQKSLGLSEKFADHSYAELNYKSDAWILNGEVEASENKYFSLLKNQTENRSYLCNYLPSNTWSFQNIILSDPLQFRSELKNQIKLNQDFYYDAELKLMMRKYGLNVDQLLAEHMGTELITAYYPNYSLLKHTGYISMIVLQQADEFNKKINDLQKNAKEILYKNYSIKTFPIRKMMYLCAGEPFKELDAKFYTIIEDRLIMSSDIIDLKTYIDNYTDEQLLKQKESFQNYISRLNDQYNYLYYTSISGFESNLKDLLQEKAQSKLLSKNTWSNYTAFSYQITSSDAGLINSIYLPLKDNTEESSLEQKWQISLESGIGSIAQWLRDGNSNKNYIVAQDDTNNFYLIDEESNILWKKPLPNAIVSEVFPVDYYKNGQTQMLFNTRTHLYLIDLEGNLMPNYPIRLSSESLLGLSLFDYDQNKNYRMFVACANQCIYGYDLSGRPLDGWNPKRVGEVIDKPQHIRVSNKDLIFVPTSQGYFYFFNRKGELQTQFRDSVNIQYFNPFYFYKNDEYAKNRFISTDQYGKIKSIFIDGRRLFKSVGTWTANHSFLYANVIGDSKKDYVFIDNNQLMVYQDDTTVGFNYQFNTSVNDLAFEFKYSQDESMLGVLSKENSQAFLFDHEGNLMKGFPIKSALKPSFLVQSNQRKMLVATSNGTLIYYIL